MRLRQGALLNVFAAFSLSTTYIGRRFISLRPSLPKHYYWLSIIGPIVPEHPQYTILKLTLINTRLLVPPTAPAQLRRRSSWLLAVRIQRVTCTYSAALSMAKLDTNAQ